jgi:hypothetical protein
MMLEMERCWVYREDLRPLTVTRIISYVFIQLVDAAVGQPTILDLWKLPFTSLEVLRF